MATVKTLTAAAAQKKLTAAKAKLAKALEAVRVAEGQVAQCQREVEAAETAVKAREETAARARAMCLASPAKTTCRMRRSPT